MQKCGYVCVISPPVLKRSLALLQKSPRQLVYAYGTARRATQRFSYDCRFLRSYSSSPTAVLKPFPCFLNVTKTPRYANNPNPKPLTVHSYAHVTCHIPSPWSPRITSVTSAGEEAGKPWPEGNLVAALPCQADLQAEAYRACRQGKALAVQNVVRRSLRHSEAVEEGVRRLRGRGVAIGCTVLEACAAFRACQAGP
jgi:hypothetical protein